MVEIVPLTEELLDEVSRLDAEIFPESPWGKETFRSNVRNDYDHPVVALHDGKVAGYGILRQIDDGEILLVGVDEESRRCGIGREIVKELLSLADGTAGVFLEVREGNEAARRLYESAGFSEIARRKNYYRNPQEDAVIMKI